MNGELVSDLYRVTGTVAASDGSSFSPLWWGDLDGARRVLEATVDGCRDRGEAFDLRIDRGPGTVAVANWSGPARDPGRAPFEVIGAGVELDFIEFELSVATVEAVEARRRGEEGATREDRGGESVVFEGSA